jgi:hypothetical protein
MRLWFYYNKQQDKIFKIEQTMICYEFFHHSWYRCKLSSCTYVYVNRNIFKLLGFVLFRKSFQVEHQRRGPEPHRLITAPASQFIFQHRLWRTFLVLYFILFLRRVAKKRGTQTKKSNMFSPHPLTATRSQYARMTCIFLSL